VGDLVAAEPGYDESTGKFSEPATGVVLRVMNDVEIPPLIEVLWENHVISRVYADELSVCRDE